MKFLIVFALVAAAAAQLSNEYLPPNVGGAVAASAPEVIYAAPSAAVESYDVGASAPAHSFSADDGYRYKTQRRRVYKTARRHRRDVSSEYLPPFQGAGSAPTSEYLPPVAASAPVASYSAPAASYSDSYEGAGSAPAHSFSSADGYRYKTQRRRVYKTARRHRRDVSTEYLPPVAASAPVASYSAPAASYSAPAASYSAPAASYSAPAASYESYDVGASAPAHSFSSDDGYRYKTQRRRVFKTARRHRRDVSSEYLPPFQGAGSAPTSEYLPPVAASSPVASYSAPAASYSDSYEGAGSAPAHSFSSADGYRYKTQRRRVYKTARRHRRDVSTEYLPPVAASAPVASYSAPAASYSAPAASYSAPAASYSAPAASYSAPAASYESYDVGASAPAHSFSADDGYRYKTQRRRVFKTARRHRRDVSAEYLPPLASNSVASYAAPAAYETYEVEASAPAHSFSSDDGYRYRTQRRRVLRRHR